MASSEGWQNLNDMLFRVSLHLSDTWLQILQKWCDNCPIARTKLRRSLIGAPSLCPAKTGRRVIELFRRMCFNVVAGNTDDHNKNFSFIMRENGHWELAPAYDITFTADIWKRSDDDIHSLGIYSKRCYFTEQDLISFGEDFEIQEPGTILEEVKNAVSQFSIIAHENGIPQNWIDRISEVLGKLVKDGNK